MPKQRRRRHAACRIETLENRLLLSAVSWVGSASGSWSTGNNWSTGAVPQPGDDVTINHAGSIQVTLSSSTSVNSVTLTGDMLTVTGGTLAIAAALSNSGALTVNPGAAISVGGTLTQASGSALTLASGSVLSGIGENLVQNGGFESPAASSGSLPDIWSQWGSTFLSNAFAHTGSQSLVEEGQNSGIQEAFSVSPGVSYSASAYALNPSNGPLTGDQGLFLNIYFTDANGNTLNNGSAWVTLASANTSTNTWTLSTTHTTAPAGAVEGHIIIQIGPYTNVNGTAGGEAYVDDVLFGPTAVSSAALTAASISNSGTINLGSASVLTDSGAFSQTTSGVLNDDLGGPPLGLQSGSLNIAGAATLGGTLKATIVGNYSPALSDAFTVMNYSSQTGSFSSVQLPSSGSNGFEDAINPTYAGISYVPLSLTTSINLASTLGTSAANEVGVNLAWWDDLLTTSQTASMVEADGLSLFRFPGGSSSDDYHFNVSANYGDSSAITIPEFAEFIQSVGGAGIVTLDYGSGSPQEAEAELAYLEGSPSDNTPIGTGIEWNDSANAWQNVNWQTVGYWASLRAATPLAHDDGLNFLRIGHTAVFTDIPYYEVGNEEYGGWEIDHHGTSGPGGVSTGAQHDPATYANFAESFASFIASDPLLAPVSIGIDSGDPTGASDNNWTRDVLAAGKAIGFVPGFISDHNYVQSAGSESDQFLLNDTVSNAASTLSWADRYSLYESMLSATVGSSASSVKIMATEYNSVNGPEGKEMTNLVAGLFVADSVGSLLDSGYSGGVFWDLRNGWDTTANNSPLLYGWRQGGDEGLLGSDGTSVPPQTGPYIGYATYYGMELASKFSLNGGSILNASSNYGEMQVYSILQANGQLALMVINKNPDANLTEQFNLTGFNADGPATIWQYGEAQDYAQSQSSTGASSLANSRSTITGGSFSYTFPAYSMTVIDLTPTLSLTASAAANPPITVASSVALSSLGSENGTGANLTYTWSATGPASVLFSGATNGTNAAQNITANFSQTGNYTFQVIIADALNQKITSSVQVTVLPAFASQTGSTVTVNLNNIAPISLAASGSNVTVTEGTYQYSFSNATAITVNGSSGTDVLNFNGPLTMPVSFTGTATTTVNVNAGTLNFAAAPDIVLGALNIATGANAAMPGANGTSTQLTVANLGIASGATLDLNNNEMFITYAGMTDPISSIAALLKSGYNSGAWNGTTGIISTAANLNSGSYALGYADSADAGNPVNLPSGTIEIKYTLLGDADLSGVVDGTDFGIVAANFNKGVSGWDQGDFNYDNVVDGTDLGDLSANFNKGAVIAAVDPVSTATTNNPGSTASASKGSGKSKTNTVLAKSTTKSAKAQQSPRHTKPY